MGCNYIFHKKNIVFKPPLKIVVHFWNREDYMNNLMFQMLNVKFILRIKCPISMVFHEESKKKKNSIHTT